MPLGGAGPSSMQSTIPPPVVPSLHRGPGDVNLAMERMVRQWCCYMVVPFLGGGRGQLPVVKGVHFLLCWMIGRMLEDISCKK